MIHNFLPAWNMLEQVCWNKQAAALFSFYASCWSAGGNISQPSFSQIWKEELQSWSSLPQDSAVIRHQNSCTADNFTMDKVWKDFCEASHPAFLQPPGCQTESRHIVYSRAWHQRYRGTLRQLPDQSRFDLDLARCFPETGMGQTSLFHLWNKMRKQKQKFYGFIANHLWPLGK